MAVNQDDDGITEYDIMRDTLIQLSMMGSVDAVKELQNLQDRTRFRALLDNMDDDEFA